MAFLMPETAKKMLTHETLRSAAKLSKGCLIVPVSLRRAIKKYLREEADPYMRRKVLSLSKSLSHIKDVNVRLKESKSIELLEDKSLERSKRWKIKSAYGDIGLTYSEDHAVAYVASRMPAVYSAIYRVLSEVHRRLPGFSPAKVVDFGAGTGSAFWALKEVWPNSIEKINIVEPSQFMQRAGRGLLQGLKNLPLIHSYSSIQALAKDINKCERKHDLVIASYVLGEIPSTEDRITIVRQLWDLTEDVLVLVEPGTPQGSKIISQMRSHILWMEKRKIRKSLGKKEGSKEIVDLKDGAFIVAPCPHDGPCPLDNTDKYCHFVQRLQRTSSQRIYKRSKGKALRGFEDEKFCYVVFRRGQRPRESWPLDGLQFETMEEQRAKRDPEDTEIDYEDSLELEDSAVVVDEETDVADEDIDDGIVPYEERRRKNYDSDVVDVDDDNDEDEDEDEDNDDEETAERADLGGGWGRIIFSPVHRGRQVTMNVCRSTNRDASEGAVDRIVVTKSKNPTMHRQARKSLWGDLWPF